MARGISIIPNELSTLHKGSEGAAKIWPGVVWRGVLMVVLSWQIWRIIEIRASLFGVFPWPAGAALCVLVLLAMIGEMIHFVVSRVRGVR